MSPISILGLSILSLGGTVDIDVRAEFLKTWLAETVLAGIDHVWKNLRASYVLEGMIHLLRDFSLILGVIPFALKRKIRREDALVKSIASR